MTTTNINTSIEVTMHRYKHKDDDATVNPALRYGFGISQFSFTSVMSYHAIFAVVETGKGLTQNCLSSGYGLLWLCFI